MWIEQSFQWLGWSEIYQDIIVNFVNKASLSNDSNIEDPEDPFEVTQYLKERLGFEYNPKEEEKYEATSTANDHGIFQK